MEALQWAGIPTILFLDPPDRQQLESFVGFEAIGVAGTSRSMSVDDMAIELTSVLLKLRELGARFVHYKTCSTFDSAPEIGSIGKAIEIGREIFGSQPVPVVIGAPNLGRYQVFGNLFARSGLDTEPFRLDRHPTMMRHPITPMNESDMRIHLARQTQLRIGLCDILQLQDSEIHEGVNKDWEADEILLFDLLFPEHLPKIGSIIERISERHSPLFVVGSSGIEYALTSFWGTQPVDGLGSRGSCFNRIMDFAPNHDTGPTLLKSQQKRRTFDAVEQLLVITGSCSPVNERQIAWAERNGFETLPIDAARLINEQTSCSEIESTVDNALERLNRGVSLILHTSRGPTDRRIAATLEVMRGLGFSELEIRLQSAKLMGTKLGRILRGILAKRAFSRVGIAGGDTSGFIARELGLIALEAIAPVAPGAPLCRAHAPNALNGVEFLFKGGQVGKDDVWGSMLTGDGI
jgi:uncharacterized protein YgbK (DUF1537 family)